MDVRVRFELPMLGHGWRDEVSVTRTPLVDNLIAAGKLTLLEEGDGETPDGQGTPTGPPSGPVPGEEPTPGVDTPAVVGSTGWFATPAGG